MKHLENRRAFLQKIGLMSVAAGAGTILPVSAITQSSKAVDLTVLPELSSLPPAQVFTVLALDRPELASVRRALEQKGQEAALTALLSYYRKRYPKPKDTARRSGSDKGYYKADGNSIERANNLEQHIFQWGPYPSANYGANINWAADPAKDIEWIAAVYRFYWLSDLTNAYEITDDERYVRTFVNLTQDWIKKHPLEKSLNVIHPVYGHWKGYAWLDLQTGIRATNICQAFRTLVHGKSFTPQFLGILLASLYDHQLKTEKLPMANVHNKAIFEQRGFINVIHTFPEFKDKDRWLDIAMTITHENLLAQTTTDGVQREWCGGYHAGVFRDVMEIDSRIHDLGRQMPSDYVHRVKAMAEHIFGLSTPELGFPMFGDTARDKISSPDRKTWQLYNMLTEAGQYFKEPKYQALADLNVAQLPKNGSVAFAEAGLYTMRKGWSTDQVYLALHCSPPAISTHDTPDNGTFELYAYGRWLMPDSGFYTYGNNPEARTWHRQTQVHATLTVNGKDTDIIGRQLGWQSNEEADMLCVENQSYKYFLHRRTVWFSGKNSDTPFFVILDEANGDLKGDLELHFPMAPGPVRIDQQARRITTGFDDANLLIQVAGKHPVSLREEEGWHAWQYGKREARSTVTAVYKGQAPTAFVSILVPYRGKTPPDCRLITDPTTLIAGRNPVEIQVEVAGRKQVLQRKV